MNPRMTMMSFLVLSLTLATLTSLAVGSSLSALICASLGIWILPFVSIPSQYPIYEELRVCKWRGLYVVWLVVLTIMVGFTSKVAIVCALTVATWALMTIACELAGMPKRRCELLQTCTVD